MLDMKDMTENIETKIKSIKDELAKERERKKEAGKEGDLRENSEYVDAETRILELEQQMASLENKLYKIKEMSDTIYKSSGYISLKSKVVIHRNDNKKDYTFTIVPAELGDALNGLVPIDSRLGSALVGKQQGDIVFVNTGVKSYTATVVAVD